MRSEMNAARGTVVLSAAAPPRRPPANRVTSAPPSLAPQLRGCCQIGRVSGYSAREREASEEARQPFPISCSIHGLPHGMDAQSLRLLLMCNCAKAAPSHHPSFRKHQAFAASSYITRSGTTPDRGKVRQPPPPPPLLIVPR